MRGSGAMMAGWRNECPESDRNSLPVICYMFSYSIFRSGLEIYPLRWMIMSA